jgi:hypothetical protein
MAEVLEAVFAPPPKVGAEFLGPPIGDSRLPGVYTVAAIVDLGHYLDDPTYYQCVFRFWAKHKKRWAYEIVSADALDVGLYKPKPPVKVRRRRGAHVPS